MGSPYPHGSRVPQHREERNGGSRQLFDHRKDDPVRFSVLTRPHGSSSSNHPIPTPKLSGDHMSASSASSCAPSILSSTFTLSSTTDGSSASSALFDQPRQATDDLASSSLSKKLERLYRAVTDLETKVKQREADMGGGCNNRVLLTGKEVVNADIDKEKLQRRVADHKELAETIHDLFQHSLDPKVPVSLRSIPQKYNIIGRLWTFSFHKILEGPRRASFKSPVALEHLQDYIYYSYTFYTDLLEESTLSSFKLNWLEALGALLARYRMSVSAMVSSGLSQSWNAGETSRGIGTLSIYSMTSLHPFPTSRESILPPWSLAAQTKRSAPDASIPDLFVPLHGMPCTNVQLDDFQPTLTRFIETLPLSWTTLPSHLPDCPPALSRALQLIFSMLSLAPRQSLCTPNAYVRSTLNPYLTVLLTFLSTILKQTADLNVLKRAIPWQELATLFSTIPRRVMASQGLLHPTAPSVSSDCWAMLTSGVAPPFSEDWCKRGVEWVGCKGFERGYWKSGDNREAELEVLEQNEGVEVSDGMGQSKTTRATMAV
ncbi:hypothetical protein FA13DRAFT_1802749 [Coprinellus micaceus]|uniref:Uncharacterized protein n=1 Tax=Coprinellus micaceus TaxID=71717 RepID=A0A4Y7SBH4_COPMI|nr:hypothetical protein FA13DRAFT_1802749 [Coprinellus micaceus]